MDGIAAQSLLTAPAAAAVATGERPRFDLATPADEPEIRRLLRDNPMDGAVQLSLEREPDSRIAAAVEGPVLHQTIVARRPEGGLFAMGTRSVRNAFVNGTPAAVGYLGTLRVDEDHRARPGVVTQGYRFLRELHNADGAASIYLTSIMADNVAARRMLEANVNGMPTYRPLGDFVTLVMRVRRRIEMLRTPSYNARRRLNHLGMRMEHGSQKRVEMIAAMVSREDCRYQFRPCWTADDLLSSTTARGLTLQDFRLAFNGDRLMGCAALWDQRSFKQTVVRGYVPAFERWRGLVNAISRPLGRPRWPDVGEPLRVAYVSHLCVDETSPEVASALIEALHAAAAARGIDYLIAGFPQGDLRLARLRRDFGGRELLSKLYVVFWPDGRAAADALDDRLCWPEVALL